MEDEDPTVIQLLDGPLHFKNNIFGMGLKTILRKLKQKDREVRVLILGLDNAGKTTIVKRMQGEDVHQISPTLGFNIHDLHRDPYHLNIWDVGGQRSLRSYWKNYFESTDALIWVVDSSDKQRIGDCRKELQNLLEEERLMGATLLVFANKQDLPGALSCDQIADALELSSIKSHHCKVFPSSAMTGLNITEGLDWLLADISSRLFSLD